ncbi:MAG: hypothetical protein AVDCRST_MAG59-2104, partial [uncultured Thermomicrobiales bacterium]
GQAGAVHVRGRTARAGRGGPPAAGAPARQGGARPGAERRPDPRHDGGRTV